jgi:phosphate transport system permease protein
MFKDRLARYLVAAGGVGVILAIVLIFFYLLYVVLPLFAPARVEPTVTYAAPGGTGEKTLLLATEEYAEVGLRLTASGRTLFFRIKDGAPLAETRLALPADVSIVSAAAGDPAQHLFVVGLSNGAAIVARHKYQISYPNDQRAITPEVVYPLGEQPITIDPSGQPLTLVAAQGNEEGTTLAAVTGDGRLLLENVRAVKSFLDDSITLERKSAAITIPSGKVTHLALGVLQRDLYAVTDDGFINYYNVADKSAPKLVDHKSVVPDGVQVTSLRFLAGGISVLVGDSKGRVAQWFPVRDENNKYTLAHIREFTGQQGGITEVIPEYFRKGFVAIDQSGRMGIYHTTAERTLLVEDISKTPLTQAAISPRADHLLALDQSETLHVIAIHNEHPEVSWNSLWGKVWYESRQQPEFIWQSSSATSDFEPKFSLTPLAFGTLKATLFAIIFAVPIAIMGAIYAGYFMSPKMRSMVKPTIEIMGAMPTVILGFLAGLWLAPLIENNLPGVFALFLLMPVLLWLCAFLWSRLPSAIRHKVGDGWEAALLIPVVCLAAYLAMELSRPMEELLFNGDMVNWINSDLGISYEQRNSLVVGIAMGFAVIPLIFSISEDAIFGVPKHLTLGSLALGATPWQTLTRVVLFTASPGIFSAIMIGVGRAVGETMIVLMATGNTPVVDLNLFQGFRALSANVAVEMPESEVNSTHYRILFLAALVLFSVTFLFNTIAELVRQRLRAKYSNL